MVRVYVDPDRCEGHARCVALAPEVFALDDEGLSRVILERPGAELLPKVEHAVRVCPRQAIFLINETNEGATAALAAPSSGTAH